MSETTPRRVEITADILASAPGLWFFLYWAHVAYERANHEVVWWAVPALITDFFLTIFVWAAASVIIQSLFNRVLELGKKQ